MDGEIRVLWRNLDRARCSRFDSDAFPTHVGSVPPIHFQGTDKDKVYTVDDVDHVFANILW